MTKLEEIQLLKEKWEYWEKERRKYEKCISPINGVFCGPEYFYEEAVREEANARVKYQNAIKE